jgi:hypothetical protein
LTVVIRQFLLMTFNLAVKLIREGIYRRVHVNVNGIRKQMPA